MVQLRAIACFLIAAAGALAATLLRNDAQPPNIVLIYIDDLGWTDLGCQGSDFYETPNIDALAAQGMRFTDAYANAPNCAPSRACLLTGQYSPRHGIYTVNSSARGKSEHRRLIPIENTTTATSTITTERPPCGSRPTC